MEHNIHWWSEDYSFFGEYYIEGDNSKKSCLATEKQTIEERTAIEGKGIVRLLDLKTQRKTKILDLPTGYGRHSIFLAKLGFTVVGSDLNSVHLKKAVESAKKEGVDIHFTKENMLEITYENEFDVVINMFYSFGFFDKDEENERVAQNFYNSLKPGGRFLMHTDVNVATIKSGKYKFREERTLRSGKNLRIIDNYNPETKRIDGSWTIGDQKKDYSVRVYEVEEFIALCKKVGFRDVKVYSDWLGSDYNETSEMVIFVAEK